MSSSRDLRWELRAGTWAGSRRRVLGRERRAELGWAAFCLACAAAMLVFPQWQTVPFHWIWITVTLLYGYRRWSGLQTGLTCSGSPP